MIRKQEMMPAVADRDQALEIERRLVFERVIALRMGFLTAVASRGTLTIAERTKTRTVLRRIDRQLGLLLADVTLQDQFPN
jgi:hypothetical protein